MEISAGVSYHAAHANSKNIIIYFVLHMHAAYPQGNPEDDMIVLSQTFKEKVSPAVNHYVTKIKRGRVRLPEVADHSFLWIYLCTSKKMGPRNHRMYLDGLL